MKIVVLEESKKRKEQIANLLEEKGHDAVICTASGEFMETIENSTPDKILLNIESWQHGRAIYTYFKFSKKLDDTPITFYNAPESFTAIPDRNPNQDDKIFTKYTEIEEVLGDI